MPLPRVDPFVIFSETLLKFYIILRLKKEEKVDCPHAIVQVEANAMKFMLVLAWRTLLKDVSSCTPEGQSLPKLDVCGLHPFQLLLSLGFEKQANLHCT